MQEATGVDHWTSRTVYECSEIAGSPQIFLSSCSPELYSIIHISNFSSKGLCANGRWAVLSAWGGEGGWIGIGRVLDLVSQVRDVVLMKCIFGSGRPQRVGILE